MHVDSKEFGTNSHLTEGPLLGMLQIYRLIPNVGQVAKDE